MQSKKKKTTIGEVLDAFNECTDAENYLAIDVTPADLIDGGRRIHLLRDILDEIDQQWPQGRDPSGNGHGSRIGTLYIYFNNGLHIHFIERGTYLQREGALTKIPEGEQLPLWLETKER